jgi:predicted  nucleic acid-binding Zn-ribbon protein
MNKIIENWGLILATLTTAIAYVTGRKSKRLDEVEKLQKAYNGFVEDMTKKYDDMKSEIVGLKKEIYDLRKENTHLKRRLNEER